MLKKSWRIQEGKCFLDNISIVVILGGGGGGGGGLGELGGNTFPLVQIHRQACKL